MLPLLKLVSILIVASLGHAFGALTATADILSSGYVISEGEDAILTADISQHKRFGDSDGNDGSDTIVGLLEGDEDQKHEEINETGTSSMDDEALLTFAGDTLLQARDHQEAHPEERRPYYAACPYYDKLMSAFWGCQVLLGARKILTRSCGNFSNIFSLKNPANPTGLWPKKLTDLGPDPPFEVPKALVVHERGTFYWLYRHVNNMYKYAYLEEEDGSVPWPPVPPGWSEQRVHYVHETNVRIVFEGFIDTPLAMTMMNEERNVMLVAIRGTLSPQEWNFDFQYQFAEGQARQDFPGGRVHQGVYGVYTLFAKEVLTEVARLQPAHVFVTGHSLGGALAHLLSYTIADRFPGMTVDSVTFASIMMADESMMAAMAEKINMRNIFYLGPGQDGLMYRVGDLIPQATCGPFHGCPLLGTGSRSERYQYAMLGSYVPFYSEDMPNTSAWKIEENTVPFVPYRFYVSTHLCSYVCWLSHGIDSETRCYFPRQSVPNEGKYREDEVCWVRSTLTQSA